MTNPPGKSDPKPKDKYDSLAKDLLVVSLGGPIVVASLAIGFCWVVGAGAMSIIDGKAPSLMKEPAKPQAHHSIFAPRHKMR